MTNRQWLMWQLLDMSDEEFARVVSFDCIYMISCDDSKICPPDDSCGGNCREGRVKWLQQEHVESNAI